MSLTVRAAVSVTAPSLTINTASFPSSYQNLGNIVITEAANGDFATGAGQTFIISAPADFEFNPGVGSISQNGGAVNLSALSISVTSTTITVTYTSGGTNKNDILTISGIQVRAINSASSGNAYRSGGTGVISGLNSGAPGTTVASFTSNQVSTCTHTIRLTDTYGDGWNGGTVKVQVNGVDVLTNAGSTFTTGSGPVDFTFDAATGDVINVVETAAGSFPTEMRVEILDGGSTSVLGPLDPSSGGSSVNGNCPSPMSITAATVTQASTDDAQRCAGNLAVISLEITTTGVTSPISVTQIQTNFSGTAGTGALNGADIYYTGTSSTFATTTLFGSNATPSTSTYNINGSQALSSGVNYFWLVYDLNNTGTVGTTIDGLITQFTAGAVDYNTGSSPALSATDPAGARSLIMCVAPGGVTSGLETWVRADMGVTGTTPITGWSNQNTTGTSILVNGSPNLNNTSTSYNYNPYVEFAAPLGTLGDGLASNRQFLKLSGYSGLTGIDYTSMFFAFQLDDLTRTYTHIGTVENVTNGSPANGTFHGDANGATASILQEAYDVTDFGTSAPAGTWRRNGLNIASNSVHSDQKHVLSANCMTGGSTTINTFLGGQRDLPDPNSFAGHPRDWKGPCAEIIGYTSVMTATERQKIDSYLALKYGMTLTFDYLSTSGGTIYTVASPFNNNIIGIGRDDIEALTQKQSHNDDDTVRIYLSSLAATNAANTGSFSSDISYIIAGANTGQMCSTTASDAEMPAGCSLYSRLEREWKVQRTNCTEAFNIDFKLADCAVPASVTTTHLRLLIDDDGNFANGGTTCYASGDVAGFSISYSQPVITVTGISTAMLPDNAVYFLTIGSVEVITPLPVELLSFDAQLNERNTVDLVWETASEINSDYFIIEKMDKDQNWNPIATQSAAGYSTQLLSYHAEDFNPSLGQNYYRLKQVDIDGAMKLSEIRLVVLNNLNDLTLYPNPAKNSFILQSSMLKSCEITFTNAMGQLLAVPVRALAVDAVEFDTRNLANGFYYVKIDDGRESTIVKLIIQK